MSASLSSPPRPSVRVAAVLLALAALLALVDAQNVLIVRDPFGSSGLATTAALMDSFPSATYTVEEEDISSSCDGLAFGSTPVDTAFDVLVYIEASNVGNCPDADANAQVMAIEDFANSGRFVLVTGPTSLFFDDAIGSLVGTMAFMGAQAAANNFNDIAACDLLLNGEADNLQGAATLFGAAQFVSSIPTTATSCLDAAANGESLWSVRPMANGGAIASMTTGLIGAPNFDDVTFTAALANFMGAANSVTGGGGDPHLFGANLPRRFDPILTLQSVRAREFERASLVLVETQSATLVAGVEQLAEGRFFVTSLRLATADASLVVAVSPAGLAFTDGLGQVTACAEEASLFGAALSNQRAAAEADGACDGSVSARGQCTGGAAQAASNRFMQRHFGAHVPLAEAHASLAMENVQVEVFSVRRGANVFLDFSVSHDLGTTFGGLLTNEAAANAERSVGGVLAASGLLERYATTV